MATNTLNGKRYIGQSKNIRLRWNSHKCAGSNYAFHNAIRKYGIENFAFDVLEFCEEDELDRLETLYIEYADCISPKGYNVRIDIRGNRGAKQRPETVAKRSAALRIAFSTPESRQKLSDRTKEFWTRPETRAKYLKQKERASAQFSVAVAQYSLSGELIAIHSGRTAAAKAINAPGGCANITACIKGRYSQAYGFLWRTIAGDEPIPLFLK